MQLLQKYIDTPQPEASEWHSWPEAESRDHSPARQDIGPIEPDVAAAACRCGWLFRWRDPYGGHHCARCQSPPAASLVADILAVVPGRGYSVVTEFVRPHLAEVFEGWGAKVKARAKGVF